MQAPSVAAVLAASLRAWGVEARVQAARGDGLVARISAAGGLELGLARVPQPHRSLPGWAFGPLHVPRERWPRAASLLALLAPLRSHLDPSFTPARAIVGVRPRAGSDAGADPR